MDRDHQYRYDIKEAIRIFRPVLQALKIRECQPSRLPVRFVDHPQLAFLKLDHWSIQLATADIDVPGIFFFKQTLQGQLRAYIVLSNNLYKNNSKAMKQVRKKVAVHEFVHFLAVVFTAAKYKRSSLRSIILEKIQNERFKNRVEKMLGPDSQRIVIAFSNVEKLKYYPVTDHHFRLGEEGKTQYYDILYYNLLFSRELFEGYFDQAKQNLFKKLHKNPKTRAAAERLLFDARDNAANDKDVSRDLADSQLREWIVDYM